MRTPPQARVCRDVACAVTSEEDGRRRVVVTGLGLVSPLGNDPAEFYGHLLEGRSGVRAISKFDASELPTRIAAEVDDEAVTQLALDGLMQKKFVKRVDPVIKFGVVAGKLALRHAGLDETGEAFKKLDKFRAGILIGSALGGYDAFGTAVQSLVTQSFRRMNPFCIPFAITNMPGAMLAMELNFMGPNYPANTACATGNYCIKLAMDHIRRGDADVMLAGGAEASVLPLGIQGFIACKALSQRNDDPAAASRPWDKGRDGFVMGEGAGVLVLESLEHAQARGAPILCEVAGAAFSCDAHHLTEPHPEGKGVSLCIQRALADARMRPEDIDYVNAHGTSTPAGDMAEYRAIMSGLAGWKGKINSTKGFTGHLLGAAGAVEAVACVQSLATGWVHPNANLENPEDDLDLNFLIGSKKEKLEPRAALSNSFGFGGHNSAVVFKKFEA